MAAEAVVETKKEFVCMHCDKSYMLNKTLLRHVREAHNGMPIPKHRDKGRKPKRATGDEYLCDQCKKVFSAKRNLRMHISYAHPDRNATNTKVPRRNNLGSHVKSEMEFNNYIEFLQWKKDEEDLTYSRFNKRHGDKRRKDDVILRCFYCHRNGNYRCKGNNMRNLKVQGSCKTGEHCPASMFVRIHNKGKVFVTYYHEHKSHSFELAHLHLHADERQEIARLLAQGVSPDSVLEKMHNRAGHEKVSHLHLLTKKHLQNIARDFDISKGIVFHKNDADSVAAWVEKSRHDSGENSILSYVKFKEEEEDSKDLQDDDDDSMIVPVEMNVSLPTPAQSSLVSNCFEHVEEVVADVVSCAPHKNEVAAILSGLPNTPYEHDGNKYKDLVMQYTYDIISRMGYDHTFDSSICQMMGRVRAFAIANEKNPVLPDVQHGAAREPANKLTTKQRMSTSKRKQKRKPSEYLNRKPTLAEAKNRLYALSGNIETVSCTRLNTDHDYDISMSEVVHFVRDY